jgi:hypothetical protein
MFLGHAEAKESPARHLVPEKEAAVKLNRLLEKDVPAQFQTSVCPDRSN